MYTAGSEIRQLVTQETICLHTCRPGGFSSTKNNTVKGLQVLSLRTGALLDGQISIECFKLFDNIKLISMTSIRS